MTRNRILAVITLISATAAAVVVAGGARSYSSAPTPTGSAVTVSHYTRVGPAASCSNDVCTGGLSHPTSLRIPAGGSPYTAIITISTQYDTSAQGHFSFGVLLYKPNHRVLHALPRSRRLAPTASPESTTLVYRVRHLVPGQHYQVRCTPNIRPNGHSQISTHHLLVVVTARPDAAS